MAIYNEELTQDEYDMLLIYRKNRKKADRKVRRRDTNLKKFAENLNVNMYPSEKWFWRKFDKYITDDGRCNEPFIGFIPDLINHKFKYIVEIDGAIHKQYNIKTKDMKKILRIAIKDTMSFA